MPSNTYTVFDGEIVSHVRNGIRRDLVSTPDGSITATLTSTPTTGATYTYWPFGNPRSTSGDANNSTPFRYKGAYGYYFDASNRHYVRARYMNGTYGRWYTQDPLWPEEIAYGYTGNNPATYFDSRGTSRKPLTTKLLSDISDRIRITTPWMPKIKRNQIIGLAFQRVAIRLMNATPNGRNFTSVARLLRVGIPTVIPDGIGDMLIGKVKIEPIIICGVPVPVPIIYSRICHNCLFYEAKAKKGAITLSYSKYQALGFLDNLASQGRKFELTNPGWKSITRLHYITTSDTSISPSLMSEAVRYGVEMIHVPIWYEGDNIFGTPVFSQRTLLPAGYEKYGKKNILIPMDPDPPLLEM